MVKTEHVLFINSIVHELYCNTDEPCWIDVTVENYDDEEYGPTVVYLAVPVDDLPISAVSTTSKSYNELYHLCPARQIFVQLAPCQSEAPPQIVKNCTISVVSYHELTNSDADFIISKFFETSRFLHNHQTYEIELKEELLGSWYYAEYYLTFSKLKKIVFMVTHMEDKNQKTLTNGIVMKSFTTLHQSGTGTNFRIPRKVYQSINFPWGLCSYVGQLVAAIEPFLNKTYVEENNTQPLFLVEGARGAGQIAVVDAMVERLGFSIHYVDCVEIMTSLAAQTESKLSAVMTRSSAQASLILCFENFEVFGCEHGNQLDLRLILAFETMLDQFFEKNKSSIIVAVANGEIKQSRVRSMFLETVTIKPLSKDERFDILRWLFKQKETLKFSQEEINEFLRRAVEKSNGLIFGDLKILVDNFLIATLAAGQEQLDINIFERESDELFKSCKEHSLSIPKVQWSEIGGLQELKEEIQNSIKLPIKHKHLMGKYMKRSGILLHGPPGTGKTLIAKAVATEHQINFLSVQGPELLNMYVGQSEENVRQVFSNAKANSPCVVFLDELDSLAPNRGHTADSGGVMDRVVSQLLSELDAILADPNCQVFILGATNRPDLIDPALLRPGRFDKLLYVGPFTKHQEKVSVLETVTSQFVLSPTVSLDDLARKIKRDITGAEIYALCSNAWLNAVRRTISKAKDAKGKGVLNQKSVLVELGDFDTALKLLPQVTG